MAIKENAELYLLELKKLLKRVQKTIHQASNEVRRHMNGFVIAIGSYVPAFKNLAIHIGVKIGPVRVDVGNTACQTPFASDYILKVE